MSSLIKHLSHTSYFLKAFFLKGVPYMFLISFAEQLIGEHIFNAKICFRALLMNHALNLI